MYGLPAKYAQANVRMKPAAPQGSASRTLTPNLSKAPKSSINLDCALGVSGREGIARLEYTASDKFGRDETASE